MINFRKFINQICYAQIFNLPLKIIHLYIALLFLITFIGAGYFLSDNRLANKIIAEKNIKSPRQAFQFLIDNKLPASTGSPVLSGKSFRELIGGDGGLWCDEGAVAISVLVGQLGFKSRLVDLIDIKSGISHHTVVQVFEKGQWVTYDFSGRRFGQDPEEIVEYDAIAFFRDYPEIHHYFILNNHFLRVAAQKIRPWVIN